MLSVRSRFAFSFILTVAGLLWLPAESRAQNPQGQDQTATKVAPEISSALAGVESGQAVVRYENGQLTIKAQSAPLIVVLGSVCSQIGAELDAPSETDEPVLGVFGPGPSREVLAAMMSGSHFNLAMAGSPDDPNELVRIVILPKTTDSATQAANDADAPPTQDSAAQSQVTEPQVGSTLTALDVESRMGQVRELFVQAQTELAQMGDEGGATNVDISNLLKEAEAQVKAAAAAEANGANSTQTVQPPAAPGTNTSAPATRHRRR